jgi:hypothetical protein
MIAREMKEYCYTEDEMRGFLGGSRGPLCLSTMRRRIYTKSHIPPFIKVAGDYWFPRDLYGDWLRKIRPTFEVHNAG